MMRFFKYFVFLVVLTVNATSDFVVVSQNVDSELKGKLTTSFILSAISNVCHEVAKISAAEDQKEKLEGTLNIVATALEVAAQAASKEEKKETKNVDIDIKKAITFLLELFILIDKNNEQIEFITDKQTIQEIKDAILVLNEWLEKNN
ncbi:MAG: hypothetical protein ABIA74_03395 [bacterium]